MKKISKLAFFLAVGCFISGPASSATFITYRTVKSILTGWNGEGLYVDVVQPIAASESGLNCSTTRLILLPNTPMYKETLALITQAYAMGLNVAFVAQDCTYGAIRFSAVQITK